MVDATPGSVYGDNARLYYSTDVASAGTFSGTLVHAGCVIDDTINDERRQADVVYRGATDIAVHVGKRKVTITGTMMVLVGTPGAQYVALRSAYLNKTLLHFAASTGDITEVGCQYTRFEGKILSWNESRPDNGNVTVSFEIAKDPGTTYATTSGVIAS